jgi:membrane protease subunit HflK
MSLNDPQWGKRGNNEGPPDLDELLRNLNSKLNGLFGRKGGNQPPNRVDGGGGGPKVGSGGAWLLILLVFLIWIASGFYIVDASNRGVVLRFGKFHETTQPGPRWHLPYPIESVEIVNLSQVRTVEVGYRNNVKSKVLKESLMLTDDENIIDIQFAVQYILKSPEDFLFNNRNTDDSVLQAAETAIREIVGKSKMDFVLYEGREQVAAQATKLAQDILDRYKTGIQISRVTMQRTRGRPTRTTSFPRPRARPHVCSRKPTVTGNGSWQMPKVSLRDSSRFSPSIRRRQASHASVCIWIPCSRYSKIPARSSSIRNRAATFFTCRSTS